MTPEPADSKKPIHFCPHCGWELEVTTREDRSPQTMLECVNTVCEGYEEALYSREDEK